MYFPTREEERYVRQGLLAEARRQPVAEELRGWSWAQPPLRPVYAAPLGVSDIAGGICSTGRDLFLRRVNGVEAPPTAAMHEGQALHQAVAETLTEAKRLIYTHGAACLPHVEALAGSAPGPAQDGGGLSTALDERLHRVRAFTVRRAVGQVEDVLSRHPRIGADALCALAVPVHVEVRLDGRLLGLSPHLCADAVSTSHGLVMELKTGVRRERHQLATTGYALALESVLEAPVDLGCVVYLRFVEGQVVVERDFHVIGDELRQTFIEERDERMRAVSEEIDPGLPTACPPACRYLPRCRPAGQVASLERPGRRAAAKVAAQGDAAATVAA